MGNLLGAPVTEKETHVGCTDEEGVEYGVCSMQGWRVHMEDAHITEGRLYAAEVPADNSNQNSMTQTPSQSQYNILPLPGHSLFAVFDGHGGKFAAVYSGRNLCRVLSRQPKFVEYAKFELDRPNKEKAMTSSKERSAYIQSGLKLLEQALSDAFVELDKEIACALHSQKVPDADTPYSHEQEQAEEEAAAAHKKPDDNDQIMTDANSPNNNNSSEDDGGGGGNDNTSSPTPATDSALQLLEEEGDSGTTACVVVLTPDWVVCANAGDSRAVISRLGNKAVALSYDHKPDDEHEERRIRAAGGYVAGGRVEGDLAVSRGLGDYRFKNMQVVMSASFSGINTSSDNSNHNQHNSQDNHQHQSQQQQHQQQALTPAMAPGEQKVSPIPEVVVQNRNPAQDEFIIVACDGIWDVQTNYEAVKTVADIFEEGEGNLGLLCEEICDIGLSMGSKDNMTALVIKLPAQKIGNGGGVTARRQRREAAQEEAERQEEKDAAEGRLHV